MRDFAGTKGQSLGDLIAALRPGDACVWCGAQLQRGAALKQVGGTSAGASGLAPDDGVTEVFLACPECGSEVCRAGSGVRIHGRGSLGAAA